MPTAFIVCYSVVLFTTVYTFCILKIWGAYPAKIRITIIWITVITQVCMILVGINAQKGVPNIIEIHRVFKIKEPTI